jgi:tetratricopeptide (TPR) repeat protein
MSFSVAYCHMTERRVICFIGKLDLLPYQQTGKTPSLDEYIQPFIQEQQFALETTDDFNKFQRLIKSHGEKKKSPILPLGRMLPSQSSGSLRVLGARNFREGECEAAVRCYTIAALFELRSPDIYEGLAAAYSALDRYDEALSALETVRSLTSEEATYKRVAEYAQLSKSSPEEIQENIGKTLSEETERLWKMAHFIFGDNEERKSQVARDYARQILGLSMEAETDVLAQELFVDEAERYLEKHPNDQEICATLAATYHLGLKKKYETVRAYLKTIAIHPEKSQFANTARYQLNMTDILEYLQELQKRHILL